MAAQSDKPTGQCCVLVVASKFAPEYTGPTVRLRRLYDGLAAAGFVATPVTVLCNSTEYSVNADFQEGPFRIIRHGWPIRLTDYLPGRLGRAAAHWAQSLLALVFLARHSKKADVLHIVGESGAAAAAVHWASWQHKPSLVELVNMGSVVRQKLFHVARPRLRQRPIALAAISAPLKERCEAAGLGAQTWYRPNPVDLQRFQPVPRSERDALRDKLGLPRQAAVIAAVAKFMPRKNQRLLVEALPNLPEPWHLALAGPHVSGGVYYQRDRSYLAEIENRIAELGLSHRVTIHIGQVDPAPYMQAADVYAQPAYGEALGTPMLEAMACGTPVVANAQEPAFREWVTDGRGALAQPEAGPFAAGMEKAAQLSADQREAMSQHIRAVAGEATIHSQYRQLMTALANAEPHSSVSVAEALDREPAGSEATPHG